VSVSQDAAAAVLLAIRRLHDTNFFFVDMPQWRRILQESTFAALIPVVCKVFYSFDVNVKQGGITVEALYHGLAEAIRGQRVPMDIFPLTWTFDTIVGAFNNFPEVRELYHFATAVAPFSLNHGRRVLLSALFVMSEGVRLDKESWAKAFTAVFFEEGFVALECVGRVTSNAAFNNCSLRCCSGLEVLELLKACYSVEDEGSVVEWNLIPFRLKLGLQERSKLSVNLQSAVEDIQRDEETVITTRSTRGYVDDRASLERGAGTVQYPAIERSFQLTRGVRLSAWLPIPAFSWVFVIREVHNIMKDTQEPGWWWRWFLFPLEGVRPPVGEINQEARDVILARPQAFSRGVTSDVDLDEVASGTFVVKESGSIMETLLPLFQRRERCAPLNVQLPEGSEKRLIGLQRLVRWDELPVVVRGETVVLPFSNGGSSSEIMISLGSEPLSWEFVVTNMTVGLFLVEEVNPLSYKCSFQKRLVGPQAQSIGTVDQMTLLQGVDMNLDYRFGLVLSQAAIDNSRKYFGFQVQLRIANLQPMSPLKMLAPRSSPSSSVGHKRGIQTLESEDEAEDGEVRHLRTHRIIDSAGQVVFINKHQALLAGVNTTVFMRTLVPIEERREKYPSAFALGPAQENANVYLEPNFIFKSAMDRCAATSTALGMGDPLKSRGRCFWGTLKDVEFLRRVALFMLDGFDSTEPKRLCMEHFADSRSTTLIASCAELVTSLRNLLLTYDDLWGVGWKTALEQKMVDFLEGFELTNNIRLEWGYVSRVVLFFFYQLQQAAQQPNQVQNMKGQSGPLVAAATLHNPGEWISFMSEAFVPFCTAYFAVDEIWRWDTKKLSEKPARPFGMESIRAVTVKATTSTGGGGGKSTKSDDKTSTTDDGSSSSKRAKTSGTDSPKLKFCIVDAFQFLGIKNALDEKVIKGCTAASCKFLHVSRKAKGHYEHQVVFQSIMTAISRSDGKVKDAWKAAMRGKGEDMFAPPFERS